MLNEPEQKVLGILEKRHLVTKAELNQLISKENGDATAVSRLMDKGLIEEVENMGNCLVITKLGLRTVKG